ncbi:MAG: hypothetical protein NW220_01830 [Leptolyngbyaceae cyanobacterium bins.349]|nr:hypothetical protein [Leptolyngbyaceae cyanobacterium bins.349]
MKYQVRCAGLPLAVYREVAAHLRQVDGVETELVSQRSREFDYAQSQIDRLQICYGDDATSAITTQVQQILAYYGDRYGTWEQVTD